MMIMKMMRATLHVVAFLIVSTSSLISFVSSFHVQHSSLLTTRTTSGFGNNRNIINNAGAAVAGIQMQSFRGDYGDRRSRYQDNSRYQDDYQYRNQYPNNRNQQQYELYPNQQYSNQQQPYQQQRLQKDDQEGGIRAAKEARLMEESGRRSFGGYGGDRFTAASASGQYPNQNQHYQQNYQQFPMQNQQYQNQYPNQYQQYQNRYPNQNQQYQNQPYQNQRYQQNQQYPRQNQQYQNRYQQQQWQQNVAQDDEEGGIRSAKEARSFEESGRSVGYGQYNQQYPNQNQQYQNQYGYSNQNQRYQQNQQYPRQNQQYQNQYPNWNQHYQHHPSNNRQQYQNQYSNQYQLNQRNYQQHPLRQRPNVAKSDSEGGIRAAKEKRLLEQEGRSYGDGIASTRYGQEGQYQQYPMPGRSYGDGFATRGRGGQYQQYPTQQQTWHQNVAKDDEEGGINAAKRARSLKSSYGGRSAGYYGGDDRFAANQEGGRRGFTEGGSYQNNAW